MRGGLSVGWSLLSPTYPIGIGPGEICDRDEPTCLPQTIRLFNAFATASDFECTWSFS